MVCRFVKFLELEWSFDVDNSQRPKKAKLKFVANLDLKYFKFT